MLNNFLKTEESKAAVVILLTWLVLMPIIIIKLFSEFAVWALILFGLVVLSMLVIYLFSRRSRTFEGLAYDERTARFSLKASRNGFFMAVALTTFLAVMTWQGSHMEVFDAVIWIWGWGMGTYMLSYLYYLWRGANIR